MIHVCIFLLHYLKQQTNRAIIYRTLSEPFQFILYLMMKAKNISRCISKNTVSEIKNDKKVPKKN
jgi:hypothetical protein